MAGPSIYDTRTFHCNRGSVSVVTNKSDSPASETDITYRSTDVTGASGIRKLHTCRTVNDPELMQTMKLKCQQQTVRGGTVTVDLRVSISSCGGAGAGGEWKQPEASRAATATAA